MKTLTACPEPDDRKHTFVLTDEEKAYFDGLLAQLPLHDPLTRYPEEYFIQLKALARKMPERLLRLLDTFKFVIEEFPQGHLVIRNLPRDEKRCTPRTPNDPVCDTTTIGEWVNMLTASALGDSFSLVNEYRGRWPNPIAPQESKMQEASSASSIKTLGWHQDLIAMKEARATWLLLTCINPASPGTGATTIASLYDALPQISSAARAILKQPIFTVDPPDSCKGKIPPIKTAVLGGDDRAPYLTYQEGGTCLVDPTNEAAQEALNELSAALNASCREIYLDRGDCLLFRNGTVGWNVAHGRSIFQPRFANAEFQTNRYYVRSYVHHSIVPIQHLAYPNTRVLVPTALYLTAF